MRKAQFKLLQNLSSKDQSSATEFGKSIHKALEHWYSLPLNQRVLDQGSQKVKRALDSYSLALDLEEAQSGALESIRRFCLSASSLYNLDPSDKRSLDSGIKILKHYFKLYIDDGLEIVCDEHGPIIERRVEYPIYEDNSIIIHVFGTIDAVMKNQFIGAFPADHKTTTQLGNDFFNRLHPNFQYTAYVLGARKCLGLDTYTFMVNGIQVAKTKQEFTRQFTQRTEEDFHEFANSVIHFVNSFLQCQDNNFFPMSTPDPCAAYGGCEYRRICEVPKSIQKSVIATAYKTN